MWGTSENHHFPQGPIPSNPPPPSFDNTVINHHHHNQVCTSYKVATTARNVKLTEHNRETFSHDKPFGQHNELF